LVAGKGAVLSGRVAGEVWGFHRHRGNFEVKRTNSRRGGEFVLDHRGVAEARPVAVRRSRNFSPTQTTHKYGIPILRPSWILLDLAGELSDDEFGHAFKEADRLGLLNEQELTACLDLGSGVKGVRKFQRLVARRHPDLKDARTLLETLFLELCERYGIERPKVNRRKGRYFPDFRWDDIGLIVEVDGYEGHAGRLAFLDDAARENDLRRLGYQVLRFTWEEVTQHPELVATLVIQEISRCRALAQGIR
jgi:very-short-patch-repair endonuclease